MQLLLKGLVILPSLHKVQFLLLNDSLHFIAIIHVLPVLCCQISGDFLKVDFELLVFARDLVDDLLLKCVL